MKSAEKGGMPQLDPEFWVSQIFWLTITFGTLFLVLSKFIPTIYFGLFTGIAMLLAMISVLTLLPSLILVSKPFGK